MGTKDIMQAKSTGEMRNLKSKKLYLQVYDELCHYIKDNDLGPGDKLPTEAEMTQMLGVSRNVLREAIKALEITGIITSKPGVGITICKSRSELSVSGMLSLLNTMNDDNLKRNIEELRSVLELGFCKKAFDTMTDETLKILEDQLRIMSENTPKNEDGRSKPNVTFAKADALFHSTLFRGVDNPLLFSLLDLFWASDTYFLKKTTHLSFDVTIEEHTQIFDSLKTRNYEQFREAIKAHFSKYSVE